MDPDSKHNTKINIKEDSILKLFRMSLNHKRQKHSLKSKVYGGIE